MDNLAAKCRPSSAARRCTSCPGGPDSRTVADANRERSAGVLREAAAPLAAAVLESALDRCGTRFLHRAADLRDGGRTSVRRGAYTRTEEIRIVRSFLL